MSGARVVVPLRWLAIRLALPAIALLIWWSRTRTNQSAFFPSLATIGRTFRQMWLFQLFGSDIVPSLVALFVGFALAVVGGVLIGTLLGSVRIVGEALDPVVDLARSVPPVAILPIVIVFAGLGQAMDITVIALAALWPTLIATRDGVANVDPKVDDVLRIYRIGRVSMLRAKLQSSAVDILSGVHVSLQVSFILMVVSQIVGATGGIGYEVLKALQTYDAPEVWAGVVLLGIIGVVLNLGFERVQRGVLRLYGIRDGGAGLS